MKAVALGTVAEEELGDPVAESGVVVSEPAAVEEFAVLETVAEVEAAVLETVAEVEAALDSAVADTEPDLVVPVVAGQEVADLAVAVDESS